MPEPLDCRVTLNIAIRVTNCDVYDSLFNQITSRDYHILQFYLPDQAEVRRNRRERCHNKVLIPKTDDQNDN